MRTFFPTSLCWATRRITVLQYCNLTTYYAGSVYQFLLILKQFSWSYNKKFLGSSFIWDTVYKWRLAIITLAFVMMCGKMLINYAMYSVPCALSGSIVYKKVFCLHQWLAAGGILFSACPCVCVSVHASSYATSLWARYLTNRLWEFHQIYNLGAVGDIDELIRFWGRRSSS